MQSSWYFFFFFNAISFLCREKKAIVLSSALRHMIFSTFSWQNIVLWRLFSIIILCLFDCNFYCFNTSPKIGFWDNVSSCLWSPNKALIGFKFNPQTFHINIIIFQLYWFELLWFWRQSNQIWKLRYHCKEVWFFFGFSFRIHTRFLFSKK